MNYYKHNVGDYRRDTTHLTLLEHGIYRQMLDQYYLDEKPLIADKERLMRSLCVRNADEVRSAENVLKDFFQLTDKGYIHTRCERELCAIYEKSEKARKSAKCRWNDKNQSVTDSNNANASKTHSERNANGMLPITEDLLPITEVKEAKPKTTPPAKIIKPETVEEQVWQDWLTLRKQKKAPVTATVLKGATREAEKAGVSLNEFLEIWCRRGSQGLEASWIKPDEKQQQSAAPIHRPLSNG